MRLRTKLLLAQLPLALSLVVIGMLAVSTVGRLGNLSQTIFNENYRSVLAMQRIIEAIERMDSAALFKLAGQWVLGEPMAAQQRRIFEAELQVEDLNITEPGEDEAARKLREVWSKYQQGYDEFTSLSDLEVASQFYFSTIYPLFNDVKKSAYDILAINQDAMMEKSYRVRQSADRMNTFMVIGSIIASLAGILFSIMLTRHLLRPLSVLSQAMQRIGEGDLEVRARVKGRDEIALLAAEFNKMTDHLEKYRRSSLGELLQAQQTTQAAIDSLPDPVLVFGVDGKLINVNAASESLLGLWLSVPAQSSDPLGSVAPELLRALGRARAHVISGKGPYLPKSFEEAERVPSSEGDRWFLVRANPLHGEEGNIVGVTVLLQDVTRFRRFDELKNDLVSTVAHELHTPLTSLHMAIHLCLEKSVGEINEKQADLLYAAREDCQRLQTLVDDLLDLARIQSGRMEMKRQPVSVRSLLESAVDLHRSAAGESSLVLAADLSGTPEGEVLADPERIQLVLTNLILNAIRHTAQGGRIDLRARNQGQMFRFEVSDTGEGIPLEYQSRIFDKFFRVPGSKSNGVGLGLSICREVIEAHGGKIGVESIPGKGSTFWFTL